MEFIVYFAKQVAQGELGITFLFENCLKRYELKVKLLRQKIPWRDERLNRILCHYGQVNR